ncbi:MAG: DUF58 domain-containing protein [Alteromonadaceae bacterium]|nr:DUF58 domain-containing protein [Alteromonadaceae bacterium]MBH84172.1 DUF58 domain-containing protein [Alteromonadaceae bacterium]|tara:strand:- start:36028 stop:36978 length:951 start_codon:yes stop_codon:yes gene_type:complete
MTDASPLTRIDLPALIRLQADARALRLPGSRPVATRKAGLAKSAQKGRGMAFAEVRLYQPGDDIRSIDWRVTARRQSPHTKLYEEERERPILLLCDLGDSLFFGSEGAYKRVRAAQVTGILAWLGLHAGDQVGGIVFSDHHCDVLRPERRRKAVVRLLDSMVQRQDDHQPGHSVSAEAPAGRALALDHALQETRRIAHTGSRIFIISDFMNISSETPALIAQIARHNTVSALRVIDPLEQQLPEKGRFAVAGANGPLWFDAGNPAFRKAFAEKVAQHERDISHCFRRAGVGVSDLYTGQQPSHVLKSILGPRGRIG